MSVWCQTQGIGLLDILSRSCPLIKHRTFGYFVQKFFVVRMELYKQDFWTFCPEVSGGVLHALWGSGFLQPARHPVQPIAKLNVPDAAGIPMEGMPAFIVTQDGASCTKNFSISGYFSGQEGEKAYVCTKKRKGGGTG